MFTLQTIQASPEAPRRDVAESSGFSLHAGIAAKPSQRDKLEHLARYQPIRSGSQLPLLISAEVRRLRCDNSLTRRRPPPFEIRVEHLQLFRVWHLPGPWPAVENHRGLILFRESRPFRHACSVGIAILHEVGPIVSHRFRDGAIISGPRQILLIQMLKDVRNLGPVWHPANVGLT